MLSVALLQTFTRFRALPGMLPCGVRTFLGPCVPAAIQPTWTYYQEIHYTIKMCQYGINCIAFQDVSWVVYNHLTRMNI